MCDMQKMPTRDDASCEEDSDMNFAAFSSAGTHFVTTSSQLPVTKIQQNVSNNGSLSQVVGVVGGMGEEVQYVRAIDGSTLQNAPQLISVPITLTGAKPGDPQPHVQIQVLGPNIALQSQQQPKYQMQIPIQGFQQGNALLTLAYSPENINGLLGLGSSSLTEGVPVLSMQPEMQMQRQQQDSKEQMTQNVHQVFITSDQQIIISSPSGEKILNNNTSSDNNNSNVIIKEEVSIDDESSQGTEASDVQWQIDNPSPDLVKYLNSLPPQQTQQLPPSLQQFLRLNPSEEKKPVVMDDSAMEEDKKDMISEAVVGEDGSIVIQNKKKKKYKKKPTKPARPKPGQVIITTAPDGALLYCCPECQMAFPEKEELEIHLTVHKIERRFICGICGAGLKRKEHLERHKLGHNPERPYVCGVCGKGFKRREHLNLHTVIHSGVKTELCGECGKGFYRKDHLRKHMRSHLTRRARDEGADLDVTVRETNNTVVLPEITIHVPTTANMQVPVQINIPQHVMSSLAAGSRDDAHATLDALLAQHS